MWPIHCRYLTMNLSVRETFCPQKNVLFRVLQHWSKFPVHSLIFSRTMQQQLSLSEWNLYLWKLWNSIIVYAIYAFVSQCWHFWREHVTYFLNAQYLYLFFKEIFKYCIWNFLFIWKLKHLFFKGIASIIFEKLIRKFILSRF